MSNHNILVWNSDRHTCDYYKEDVYPTWICQFIRCGTHNFTMWNTQFHNVEHTEERDSIIVIKLSNCSYGI